MEAWQSELAKEAAKSADADAALARTRAWWAEFWARSWVFVRESFGVPVNTQPLRVGIDSNGQSRFAGEIEPQAVEAGAWTAEQLTAAFAAGRPGIKAKFEPHVPQGNAGLTLAAWIKPTGVTSGRIFDKCTAGTADGFLLDAYPGNALRLIAGAEILQSPACLKTDQWQQVIATLDAPRGRWPSTWMAA